MPARSIGASSSTDNTVALFTDLWILPGLHATLSSLLAHANPSTSLRILVFGERLTAREEELLHRTAKPWLETHRLEIRPFTMPALRRVRSLRGNYTTGAPVSSRSHRGCPKLPVPGLRPDRDVCGATSMARVDRRLRESAI